MSFLDKASDAIRVAGGRLTPQRQIIIEVLATTADRVDADTVHQLARQQDVNINLTTVYRTLETLETAGLVRSQYISSDHDRKYYTLVAGLYHFTCRQCHQVISFTSDLVDELRQRLELDLHVQTLNACVCVDGLCPDCQARQQKEQEALMTEIATLDQLSPGQKAHVKRIGGQGAVRRRLMDMGLVRGVEIELIKAAPMGDPLEFRLRGYNLSLRRAEAHAVEIES